jgi:hypothetical protein
MPSFLRFATPDRISRVTFTAILFVVAALAVRSQQSGWIVVVSIEGDWKYHNRPVTFGQTLPAEGCLVANEGSLVLKTADKNSGGVPLLCEKLRRDPLCGEREPGRCAVPLNPEKWPKTGGWGDTWEALSHFLTKDPDKYMVAASRGVEPGLDDAVVPQQAGGVDLGPAFREMEAGHYWIQISPAGKTPQSLKTFELQFAPHGPALITAPSLQPGLYKVVLVDKSGGPAGSDCWILISSPENYPAASKAFQNAATESSKWPDAMDPAATRALLRAYLESLSTAGPRSQP